MARLALSPAEPDDLDLATCDREPIHIPGSIQPHGALFVVDPDSRLILQAAVGEIGAVLTSADPVGRTIDELLPPEAAAALAGLDRRPSGGGVDHLGLIRARGASFHLVAHRAGSVLIVELEQASGEGPGSFDEVYPYVREFLDSLHSTSGIEELANLAAREVRRITGLDRALVYRFDEEWNGAVIAKEVERALGLGAGSGCAYFRSYGADIGRMWTSFRAHLIAGSSPADQTEIIAAANATFETLRLWLCTESSHL